jgi:hypothetical protein
MQTCGTGVDMAKRRISKGTKGDALERRVLAFAEQMGYVAGTLQSRAEGLMDRQSLNRQLTSVRNGAASLLKQMASGAKSLARRKRAPAAKRTRTTGRSGGVVDAPGKKHRKPAPADPRVAKARNQTAKMREAQSMAKTRRHQARG